MKKYTSKIIFTALLFIAPAALILAFINIDLGIDSDNVGKPLQPDHVSVADCHEEYYVPYFGNFYRYEVYEDYYDDTEEYEHMVRFYMMDDTVREEPYEEVFGTQTIEIQRSHNMWCIGDDE